MSDVQATYWKKCSICKKEIQFSSQYYICSVSTCQHKRKGFRFCSVSCWDAHLGFMNHRESWAKEATAPSREEYLREQRTGEGTSTASRAPVRKVVSSGSEKDQSTPTGSSTATPVALQASKISTDTLVVVSKVKKLVKELSGFNTSQCCVDRLTKKVIEECLKGIEKAKQDERKTVMGRDIH